MRLRSFPLVAVLAASPAMADCNTEAGRFIELSPYAGVQYGLREAKDLVEREDRLVLVADAYFIAFDQFNAKPDVPGWPEMLINADALMTCFEGDMKRQLDAGSLSVVNFDLEIDNATRTDVLSRAKAAIGGG